ncbi:hypothetical protein SteCoe_27694 [Stentor coeruleus]|uniref:Protein kinase domain-containing protein n=1 Tax=Stentor coeruleus TaxID=5963 RepID=A0A1R2B9W9_9CILI|nr:hypothetical protein SteCoe_27694 [Stentor coeruleus]
MEENSNPKSVTIFLNGKLDKKCEVKLYKRLTVTDIIQGCKEKLSLNNHIKCKLLDSRGEELSDDDLEFINNEEPLFLSQGEKFAKSSSMAIYQEIRKLGQGGFGTVYLYRSKLTNKEVAIKFVDLRKIFSPQDVQRLFSEISILRGLKHRNIVDLIDVFDLENKSCFVMEYCSGGELKEYVQNSGPLSEKEVYRIVIQIVDAIRYCHNSSIVHRDLKLENILFLRPSHKTVKIVDFGISGMFFLGKASENERSDAGSLHYIAPEVLTRSDNRANPALDIWSLGCIIYAMLTKTLPFLGKTRKEIMSKIINCEYQPLPTTISKPWHKLIKGMLRKRPDSRWDMIRISDHLFKYKDLENVDVSEDSFEKISKIVPAKSNGFFNVRRDRGKTPDKANAIKAIRKVTPNHCKRNNSNTPPEPGILNRRATNIEKAVPLRFKNFK